MMPADRQQETLLKILSCTGCGADGLRPVAGSDGLYCAGCGKRFPVINGIPCFVPDELVNFSEVDEADRSFFIRAKRLAYSGNSVVSRMYNHYHRYAAVQRLQVGVTPLTLDIGCGIGEHYRFISKRERTAGSYVGLDLDRYKLEYFHDLYREIPLVQATAFDLPFRSGCFDVVQLLATLEHFNYAHTVRVLDESLRVLRPGGVLITSYPAEGSYLLRIGQVIMHSYVRLKTSFDLEDGAVHRHLSTAKELDRIIDDRSDLENVDRTYYPLGVRNIHGSLFINSTYRKKRAQDL